MECFRQYGKPKDVLFIKNQYLSVLCGKLETLHRKSRDITLWIVRAVPKRIEHWPSCLSNCDLWHSP